MHNILTVIFLVCLMPLFSIGQDLSKSLVFREGDKLFESGQYVKAMRFYKDVLDQEPGHLGALFQMGECYRLTFDYESALFYYEKVSKEDDSRFPLAKFYYAEMLKHEGATVRLMHRQGSTAGPVHHIQWQRGRCARIFCWIAESC